MDHVPKHWRLTLYLKVPMLVITQSIDSNLSPLGYVTSAPDPTNPSGIHPEQVQFIKPWNLIIPQIIWQRCSSFLTLSPVSGQRDFLLPLSTIVHMSGTWCAVWRGRITPPFLGHVVYDPVNIPNIRSIDLNESKPTGVSLDDKGKPQKIGQEPVKFSA